MKKPRLVFGWIVTALGPFVWILDQLGRLEMFRSVLPSTIIPWIAPVLIAVGIGLFAWSDFGVETRPLLYGPGDVLLTGSRKRRLVLHVVAAILSGIFLAAFVVIAPVALQKYISPVVAIKTTPTESPKRSSPNSAPKQPQTTKRDNAKLVPTRPSRPHTASRAGPSDHRTDKNPALKSPNSASSVQPGLESGTSTEQRGSPSRPIEAPQAPSTATFIENGRSFTRASMHDLMALFKTHTTLQGDKSMAPFKGLWIKVKGAVTFLGRDGPVGYAIGVKEGEDQAGCHSVNPPSEYVSSLNYSDTVTVQGH